ncbi:MAG: MFS transporter [Proteobacteria bacterium]|nr:MFS transporter [Pseudomonadota bacterium]
MPSQSLASADRSYLIWLLAFICFMTLFEGYDLLIINLALPYLGTEFGVDSQTLGSAVGLINVGTILAFIPVRLADRYGRRPVFLCAVLGYTMFTLLSASSFGLYDFVAYQFFARMFMVTEISLAAIILTEEMPARYRGIAVTLMFSLSLCGGILGSVIFPYLVDTELGWRMLYVIGAVAAPVLIFYWAKLRETRRFVEGAIEEISIPIMQSFKAIKTVFHARFRRRATAGATIWFTVNAWSSSCLFFFSYYVTNERDWDAGAVSYALTLAYSLAIIGYATAGPMLDFAGRRLTATVYFSIGAIAAYICFSAQSAPVITAAYVVVLGMHAVWPIAGTITSEIFPTEIRATANAVVNHLLGRIGMALAPAVVGALSAVLGSIGQAVALISLIPFVCLPIIWLTVRETKGQELEDIQP